MIISAEEQGRKGPLVMHLFFLLPVPQIAVQHTKHSPETVFRSFIEAFVL